jgi:hypothetical protein
MSLEFREVRSTGRIHIFDVNRDGGGKSVPLPRPICKTKVGAMTYPLELDDAEDPRVCRHCLKRRS